MPSSLAGWASRVNASQTFGGALRNVACAQGPPEECDALEFASIGRTIWNRSQHSATYFARTQSQAASLGTVTKDTHLRNEV